MKLAQSLKKKKTWLVPVIALVIVIALAATYLLVNHFTNAENINKSGTSSNKTPTSGKDGSTAPSEGLPNDSSTTTTEDVPVNENLSVKIASFAQTNGTVNASITTNNSGTCVITFTPSDGGRPVTRQVAVENNECKVSIPESEFTYLGQWSLTATLYNNSEKAEVQQNVSIN